MPTIEVSPSVAGDDGRRHSFGLFSAGSQPYVGVTSPNLFGWFRFPGVTVPQGATIDVAYVAAARAGGSNGETVRMTIAGIAEDDHVAPVDNSEWVTDHGIHTTATVADTFTQSDAGSYQTPSLVSIIQEIIDRPGWASGNAIGIHFDENGSDANAFQEFEDQEGADPAVLHIEYTAAGGGGGGNLLLLGVG